MRPKNYLFILSIGFLMGCTETAQDHSACEAKMDSLTGIQDEKIDALNSEIQSKSDEIAKLENEYQELMDSLNISVKASGKTPTVVKKSPQGLPTPDPN